jgi:hypothetical protein
MDIHHSEALGGAKSVPQTRTLTELGIRAAHPPERGTFTIWDGSLKNFGIRISQGGTKSFVLSSRVRSSALPRRRRECQR